MSDFSVNQNPVVNAFSEMANSIKTQLGKLMGRLIRLINPNKDCDTTTAKVAQILPSYEPPEIPETHTYSQLSSDEKMQAKITLAYELLSGESEVAESIDDEEEPYIVKDLLSEPEIPKGSAPDIAKLLQASEHLAEAEEELNKADKLELEKLQNTKTETPPPSNKTTQSVLDAEQEFLLNLLNRNNRLP